MPLVGNINLSNVPVYDTIIIHDGGGNTARRVIHFQGSLYIEITDPRLDILDKSLFRDQDLPMIEELSGGFPTWSSTDATGHVVTELQLVY